MAKNTDKVDIRSVKPSQVREAIEIAAEIKRSCMIWGPPGIGKSDLVRQLATDLSRGRDGKVDAKKHVPVYDVRLLLMEPTDLRGLPVKHEERVKIDGKETMLTEARWAQPSMLPKQFIDNIKVDGKETDPDTALRELVTNDRPAVLFLDEITAAPPSVQAAAYQLVLDRKVGDYKLPEQTIIIAAGNRVSDKGVAHKMPTPLANRFIHLEMVADFEDWAEWAIGERIHPSVIGYLSMKESKLFDFNPRGKDSDRAFPTPRSWAVVSDILYRAEKRNTSKDMISILVSGTIGTGVASEFVGHRDYADKLPHVKDILSGKAKKMDTDNISAMYFLASSLCYELKDRYEEAVEKGRLDEFNKMSNNFFEFIMDNFRQELTVMAVRTALKRYEIEFAMAVLPAWERFFKQYGKLVANSMSNDND